MQILVGKIKRPLICSQVRRHLVESHDQLSDFVTALSGKLNFKIAVSNLPGSIRQILNRVGQAACQVDTEPDRQGNDDYGDQQQGKNVGCRYRAFEDLQLPEFVVGVGYLLHLADQGVGYVVVDDDHPDDVFCIPGRVYRNDPPDKVGFADGVYPAQLLSLENSVQVCR